MNKSDSENEIPSRNILQEFSLEILGQRQNFLPNNEPNTPKSEVSNWWQAIWIKFADSTTGHGFAHQLNAKSRFAKLTWSLILASLITLLLASVTEVTYSTFIHPDTFYDLVYQSNQTMVYPDLHICDASIFSRGKLRSMGINDTMATYMALSLSTSLIVTKVRKDRVYRRRLDWEMRNLVRSHGTLSNIFQASALTCQDMIVACVRSTVYLNSSECCERYFGDKTGLNSFGACISTHNRRTPIVEHVESYASGLIFFVRPNQDRISFDPNIMTPSSSPKSGITFAIGDHSTHMLTSLINAGEAATPGYWTTVDRLNLKEAYFAPYGCTDASQVRCTNLLRGYRNYSLMNCRMALVQNVMEHEQNCSLSSLPSASNLNPCHPSQIIDFFNEPNLIRVKEYKDGNCTSECIENKYFAKVSNAQLKLSAEQNQLGWKEDHIAAIHFYYPSFTYTLQKYYPESLFTWLGIVGGNMGFYTGASLITVLEAVLFFCKCLIAFGSKIVDFRVTLR